MVPACEMATTMARRHQAVTSPLAAAARATVPRCVRVRRRSWMMRAKTGKAVMLIVMAMKSAKGRKGTSRP